MDTNEKQAYLHGGRMAGEYLESIQMYNMHGMTPKEWLTFLECVCRNYHNEFIRLESLSQSQLED